MTCVSLTGLLQLLHVVGRMVPSSQPGHGDEHKTRQAGYTVGAQQMALSSRLSLRILSMENLYVHSHLFCFFLRGGMGETGSHSGLALNNFQRSACFSLLSVGIKSVCHHYARICWATFNLLILSHVPRKPCLKKTSPLASFFLSDSPSQLGHHHCCPR